MKKILDENGKVVYYIYCAKQKWRNWQTRRLQVPVVAISCGFKSHLLHNKKETLSKGFLFVMQMAEMIFQNALARQGTDLLPGCIWPQKRERDRPPGQRAPGAAVQRSPARLRTRPQEENECQDSFNIRRFTSFCSVFGAISSASASPFTIRT